MVYDEDRAGIIKEGLAQAQLNSESDVDHINEHSNIVQAKLNSNSDPFALAQQGYQNRSTVIQPYQYGLYTPEDQQRILQEDTSAQYIDAVNEEERQYKEKAAQQDIGAQFGNFLVQLGSEIGLGTVEGFLDLFDGIITQGGRLFKNDFFYEDPANNAIHTLKNKIRDDWFKIYQKNPDKFFEFTDPGWLFNNATSIATTVSLMAPTVGTAKAISVAGKATKTIQGVNTANRFVSKGLTKAGTKLADKFEHIDRSTLGKTIRSQELVAKELGHIEEAIGTAFLSRTAEGYMEGRETRDNVYSDAIDEFNSMSSKERASFIARNPEFAGMSDDDIAHTLANRAALSTFDKNYRLLLMDALQYRALGSFFDNTSNSVNNAKTRLAAQNARRRMAGETEKAITRKARLANNIKYAVTHPIKSLAVLEPLEGLEEMLQYGFSENSEGDIKKYFDPNYTDRSLASFLTDPAMWEQGMWGAIGGIVFGSAYKGGQRGLQRLNAFREFKKGEITAEQYEKLRQSASDVVVKELEGSSERTKELFESLQAIEEGRNPFAYEIDPETGKRTKKKDNISETIQEEEKDRYRNELLDEFVKNSVFDAVDNGYYNLLRDVLVSNEFERQARAEMGESLTEETRIREEIGNRMTKVADSYSAALRNVFAEGGNNPFVTRMAARHIVRNNMAIENLDDILSSINQIVDNLNQNHEDFSGNRSSNIMMVFGNKVQELLDLKEHYTAEYGSRNISYDAYKAHINEINSQLKALLNFVSNNVSSSDNAVLKFLNDFQSIINGNPNYKLEDTLQAFNELRINYTDKSNAKPAANINGLQKQEAMLLRDRVLLNTRNPKTKDDFKQIYEDFEIGFDAFVQKKIDGFFNDIEKYLRNANDVDVAIRELLRNDSEVVGKDLSDVLSFLKYGFIDLQSSRAIGQSFINKQFNDLINKVRKERLDSEREEQENKENDVVVPDAPESTSITDANIDNSNDQTNNDQINNEQINNEQTNTNTNTNGTNNNTNQVNRRTPVTDIDVLQTDESTGIKPDPALLLLDEQEDASVVQKPEDVIDDIDSTSIIKIEIQHTVYQLAYSNSKKFKEMANNYLNGNDKDYNDLINKIVADYVAKYNLRAEDIRGFVEQNVGFTIGMVAAQTNNAKIIQFAQAVAVKINEHDAKHYSVSDLITGKNITDKNSTIISDFLDEYCNLVKVPEINEKKVVNVSELFKFLLSDKCSFDNNTIANIYNNLGLYIDNVKDSKYLFSGFDATIGRMTAEEFIEKLNAEKNFEIDNDIIHIFPLRPEERTAEVKKAMLYANKGGKCVIKTGHSAAGTTHLDIFVEMPNGKKGVKEVKIGTLRTINIQESNTEGFRVYTPVSHFSGFRNAMNVDSNGDITLDCDFLFEGLLDENRNPAAKELFNILQEYQIGMMIAVNEYKNSKDEKKYKKDIEKLLSDDSIKTVLNNELIKNLLDTGSYKYYLGATGKDVLTDRQKAKQLIESINAILFCNAGNSNLTAQENSAECNMSMSHSLQSYIDWKHNVYNNYRITNMLQNALETESTGVTVNFSIPVGVYGNSRKNRNEYSNIGDLGFDTDSNSSGYNKLVIVKGGRLIDENGKDVGPAPQTLKPFSIGYVTYNDNGIIRIATCDTAQSLNNTNKELVAQLQEHIEHIFQMQLDNTDDAKHEEIYKEIDGLLNSLFGSSRQFRLFKFSSTRGNRFEIRKDKESKNISIRCNDKNVVTFHKKHNNESNSNAITLYNYKSLDNNGDPERIVITNFQNNRQLISSVVNILTSNVRLNRYEDCFTGNKQATNSLLFSKDGDKSFTLHLYDKNGNKVDKQYNNYGDFISKNRGFNSSAYKENNSFVVETVYYHKAGIETKIRDTDKDVAIEGTPVSDILFSPENEKRKTIDTQDVLAAAGISQEKIDVLFGKKTGLRLVNTKIYADRTERKEDDQTKAYYDKKTNRIYITPLGARVMENNPNNALRIILHENFHRLFSLKSSYNENERKRIINDLKEVYDYVVEQLNNDIKNNTDGKTDLYQQILNVLNTATSYGNDDINMEEFFVECFTQKALVDYLNNKDWRSSVNISGIPQQKKSIFQRILDILLDLLGTESTNIRNNSILAREYQIFTRDNVTIDNSRTLFDQDIDTTDKNKDAIDPNVQKGVDKITEIKETFGQRIKRDLNFNENHIYLLDGKPVEISVTQSIHGNTDVGSWGIPSSTIGTSTDVAARNHFAHRDESIPNVEHDDNYGQHPRENTDLALKQDMKKIEEYLDKKFGAGRYAVITEEFPIGGVLHKDGKDITIAGTMDMVVVDDKGNIYIYDFKTKRANSNPDFDSQTLHQYSKQLNMYKELIEANFPELKGKVHVGGLVKFLTNYPAPGDSTIDGEKHHVEYRRSSDNENQLQISVDNSEFVDIQSQDNSLEYVAPYLADEFIIDPITENSGEQITGLPEEQSQNAQEGQEETANNTIGVDSGFNDNTVNNENNSIDDIDEDYDASEDIDLNDDELFSRTDLIEDLSATKPEGVYVSDSQRKRLNEINLNRNNNVRQDIRPKIRREMTAEQRIAYNAIREMLRNSGINVQELSEDAINALAQAQLMTVYHGSGADFDEFDHSHMGEGEGVQAYGWGSYVTEVEGIGKSYAISTAKNNNKYYSYTSTTYRGRVTKLSYKNHNIDNIPQNKLRIINDLIRLIQIKSSSKNGIIVDWRDEPVDKWDIEVVNIYIQEMLNDIYTSQMLDEYPIVISSYEYGEKYLKELDANDFDISISWEQMRNSTPIFYTVEIPDNTGENYLHWDNDIAVETRKKIFRPLINNDAYLEKELRFHIAGRAIYFLLKTILGSPKAASQHLSSLGFTGIVYPANYTTGGRPDNAKNYVIFNEKDLKIKDKIQLMQDKDRVVYGATVGGKIYLNGERLNPESPIHEYTHIWDSACKKKNPELWKRGVELLKQTSLWEQVRSDENYADIKDDEDRVASEVHSRLTGKDGAALLEEMAKGSTSKGVIAKLKQWLKDFWWWCKDTFSPWTKEEAERVSLDDFVNMPLKDLAQGRNLHSEDIADENTQFFIGKKAREQYEAMLRKRNVPEEWIKQSLDYLHSLEDTKDNGKKIKIAVKWLGDGTIRLPEDIEKVNQALDVATKAKVDPMQYKSPMELLEAHANFKPTQKRIDPDTVSTLKNKKEYDDGIVVYDVEESEESRKNMREIINTHFGKDASPWCLLQGDGEGNLTEASRRYWDHYNAYQKRVVFRNGKLLVFCANDSKKIVWWDRQDEPHDGIPVTRKMPNDELDRTATYEYIIDEDAGGHYGNPTDIHRGNKQNGLYEEWDDNGTLRERAHYKDGKKDGLYEAWYDNGNPWLRSNYKDGKRDGLYEAWHDNGKPKARINFKDNKEDGLYEAWHDNGKPWIHSNYKDGRRDGLYEAWHDNGNSWLHSNYKDNEEDGLYEAWHRNGTLRERVNYKDGKRDGLYEAWYDDGKPQERVNYKDGKRDGLNEAWYDDGKPQERVNYKDGERDGLYEAWYDNGTLRERTNYKDGERDGLYEAWDDNGTLQEHNFYINNRQVSEEEWRRHVAEKKNTDNIRYATTNSIEDTSKGTRKTFSDRYEFLNNDNKKTTVEIFSQPIADGATTSVYGVVSINNLNDFINEFPLQYRSQIEQLLNDSEFNYVCS